MREALVIGALVLASAVAGSDEKPTPSAETIVVDQRAALRPGGADAGVAASNLKLMVSIPKPPGFFDPNATLGLPLNTRGKMGYQPGDMVFFNSDMAFYAGRLVVGNYHGFNIYDILNRDRPRLIASVVCPSGEGDVAVAGNLLFLSAQNAIGRLDCGIGSADHAPSHQRFMGVRVFDLSVEGRPRQVAAVQTCRGSHTLTLVPDPHDSEVVYIYNSGIILPARPKEELAGCSGAEPEQDPNTSLYSIDVIRIPLHNPEQAAIVSRPRLFTDPTTGNIAGLWKGGDHGPGTQVTGPTDSCHDIAVYPQRNLAAAACLGNGLLLDISDPVNPIRLDVAMSPYVEFWHGAVFSNDATRIVFTDEWGGGIGPHCQLGDPLHWGGDLIVGVHDQKMTEPLGYYKLKGAQSATDNCTAHNGNLIPVPGRDIMVQAWYSGGTSVFDFTDPAHPFEIAYFDRGPADAHKIIPVGHFSSYWYNGRIYASEQARGLDVLKLEPSAWLTQNEIAAAEQVSVPTLNPQTQYQTIWPDTVVVAKAYLDQLSRGVTLSRPQIGRIASALKSLGSSGRRPGRFNDLATHLDQVARRVQGPDLERLRGIARVLRRDGHQ